MDKEIILLPSDIGGNGMSGNGAEYINDFVISDVEFEALTKDFV